MRNVIFTDILRAFRKKGLLICLGVVVLLQGLALVVTLVHPFESMGGVDGTFEVFTEAFIVFNAYLIGVPIFSIVYSDDFKSRSMQVALGYGITRKKMITARFLEVVILTVEAHIFVTLLIFITGLICGVSMYMIGALIVEAWVFSLKMLGFLSLSLILVYGTQKPTLGLVMFILLSAGVFGAIINLVDMIPFLKNNDIELSKVFPSSIISKVMHYANDDRYLRALVPSTVFLAVYVILPVIISMRLFKNKELEF